jgi:opacity protein-like surface antigen
MKKLFFFILFSSSFLFAQTRFGLTGGLTIGSLTGNSVKNADTRYGFSLGVLLDIPLGYGFSIQPEATYTQKGATASQPLAYTHVDVTYEYDYIDIPLKLKYTVPTQSNVSPYIFAGPALCILSNASLTAEVNGNSSSTDIKNQSDSDFGMVFGAGFHVNYTKTALMLGAQYYFGFNSVDQSTPIAGDVKVNCLSFMIAYEF